MTEKLDEKNPFIVLLKSLTDTIVKLTQAMDGMNQRLLTLEEIHKTKQFTNKVNKNIDNMLDQ
jgi:uncharacterized protein Yka (UPF0111/DUF47 family)|tara:strand:- start:85 stop:273 length:189 start_codon:yes stop_codon:yes gene_type:complete